jgi:ribonuclease HI
MSQTKKGLVLDRGFPKEHMVQVAVREFRLMPIREEYVELAPENWNEDGEDEITIRFRFDRPALTAITPITLDEFRSHFDSMAPVLLETDGACSGNPLPGGWGHLLAQGNVYTMQHGGQVKTTSNQMELKALAEGLAQPFFTNPVYLVIESDSARCLHMMMEGAKVCEANGWRKFGGGDVKNRPLVEEIAAKLKPLRVEFRKVAAHRRDQWNEKADRLAAQGRDEAGGLPKCRFTIETEERTIPFKERAMSPGAELEELWNTLQGEASTILPELTK